MATAAEYLTADKLLTIVDNTKTSEEKFKIAYVIVEECKKFLGLSSNQKLAFLGPFKQVLFGDCNEPQPRRLKLIERTKWSSWNNKRGITKEEATEQYVGFGKQIIVENKEKINVHFVKNELTEDKIRAKIIPVDKIKEIVQNAKAAKQKGSSDTIETKPTEKSSFLLTAYKATNAASGKSIDEPTSASNTGRVTAAPKPNSVTLT